MDDTLRRAPRKPVASRSVPLGLDFCRDLPESGRRFAHRVSSIAARQSQGLSLVKKLPPGGKCEIIVLLNIQSGWHINSNSVVKEWQIPTELSVSSKLGTQLARIDYPKGRLAHVPGSDEPVPVFERQVTIRGELAMPREAAGQTEDFRIQVRYQACNEHECEQPKVLRLSGKVAIAADGEAVEEANSNLFPKSR